MDNSTFDTYTQQQDEWMFPATEFCPGFVMFRKVFHGTIAVLTIVGNCWCCFVIPRARDFRKATKIFLLSLKISDLFLGVCVTIPSFILYWGHTFPSTIDDKLCNFIGKAHLTLNIVSTLSLLGVNLERYLLCEFSLRAPSMITTKLAKMYIGLVYFIASLFLTLYLIFPLTHSTVFDKSRLICRVFDNVHDVRTVISFTLTSTIFVVIPFIILTAMYARIYWITHRHNQRAVKYDSAYNPLSGRQVCRVVCQKDAKALVTFLIVTVSFEIAWAPIVSLQLYKLLSGEEASVYLESSFYILLLSNYWWNIVIYITRNQSCRKTSLKLLSLCPLFRYVKQYSEVSTYSNDGSHHYHETPSESDVDKIKMVSVQTM